MSEKEIKDRLYKRYLEAVEKTKKLAADKKTLNRLKKEVEERRNEIESFGRFSYYCTNADLDIVRIGNGEEDD